MACLQIYWELLLLTTFLQVHSNSKKVSYLSLQNTYLNLKTTCHIELKFLLWTKLPYLNLKTTCHIKLKFLLWTKLPERLLLVKYLISVAATLISLWRRPACQALLKILDVSEKRPHFSWWSTILLFTSFSETLLTIERRLTVW